MLNEKRVKHMVKMASYESNEGKEELNITTYFRKDYVTLNVLCTLIWTTVAYAILILILGFGFMDIILENLTLIKAGILIGAVLVVYVVLLCVFGSIASTFYAKKHARAGKHVGIYKKQLETLQRMYEKEAK